MKNKTLILIAVSISIIGNIWLGIKDFQNKFLIEEAVIQEMYQEMAMVDIFFFYQILN